MQRCPYCRSDRISGRVRAREMALASRDPYDYLVCADCGSIRIARPPNDLQRFRVADEVVEAGEGPPAAPRLLLAAAGRLLCPRMLAALRPLLRDPPAWLWPLLAPDLQAVLFAVPSRDIRILVAGPAGAALVARLRSLGFRRAAAAEGEEAGPDDDPYDLICLRHALEPQANPVAALARAAARLAPGGAILAQVANAGASEFERWRGDWWGLQAPRHLSLPTRRGLELAAADAGLELADQVSTSRPEDYLYSREYNLDIADLDPQSWHSRGATCIWRRRHLREVRGKARRLNATEHADRVAFLLRRRKVADHSEGPPLPG